MRLRRVAILLAIMVVISSPVGLAVAGKFYSNKQSARNRGCVPSNRYGHDTPRFGASEFAVANAAVGPEDAQRKPFHFRATAVTVDHLQLDQVGLAIYEARDTAKLIATGRITHDGGDGGLIGSNVTIRIRAYVASSADPNQIPPDAVVVWRTEQRLWIPRGRPQHVPLAAEPLLLSQAAKSPHLYCGTDFESLMQAERLKRHFDDITHLEVEMEYERDR